MKSGQVYHFEDSAAVDFNPVTSDGTVLNDSSATVEPISVEDPRTEFFGTNEFHRFNATVARPIKQKYHLDTPDGTEVVLLKKPAEELRQSLWQIENCPWTVGHPPAKSITDLDEMRGFWKNPYYEDGQKATLYVPANDAEALQTVSETKSISIGFKASLELTDSHTADVDGYQRGLIFDHIASVKEGRCSVEDGCGIHTDSPGASGTPVAPSPRLNDSGKFALYADSGGCDCGDGANSALENGLEYLTVDAVRKKNDAVDSRLSELEREVSNLREKVAERRKRELNEMKSTPSDAERRDDGSFDLRKNTS
ncbi:DUF2213 domain-containing protein [Haloarcula rubripromontorii]|uniref:DUF2213 domain-containing protein n=1 Tax=Haloarcula rubripromontorii TaxID=1705562 RepID=A0A847TTE0_9EURY|nr:DUF2213 domain-containing protein [Haloarcula rubripromontorii]NLV06443.1 DUF2213 domain-containing protein [Haloarcula rubripromontorii]